MIPTILIGDQIFAKMLSEVGSIQRKDIVIFPSPPDPSIDFIKRVIALEGETIEIKNDTVYINGKMLEESYIFLDPQMSNSSKVLNQYLRQI